MGRVVVATVASARTALVGGTSILTGYVGLLSVLGLLPRRGTPGATTPTHRFAVLVPAHDEAIVIGEAIDALVGQRYPRELVAVHVVADNCSDRTAEIAAAHGAEAHDRVAPEQPGKGPALNWLLARLLTRGDRFDAVVIVDADTTLDPGFLAAADRGLAAGAVAAQGRYSVRAPEASTAAGIRYAALACRHHLRPAGRMRLGGSCGLFGNGMIIRTDLAAARPWTGHLIEDMEYQLELLLDGHRVEYLPDAVLEAEMPDSLEASTSQNQRWELGRIQLARSVVPRLIDRLRRGGPPGRVATADALLDQVVPPLSLLVGLQGASVGAAALLALVRGRRADRCQLAISVAGGAVVVGHVIAGLVSVMAPRSVYRSLLGAPRAIAWKLGLLAGVVARPDDVRWIRTERNAAAPS